MTIELIKKLKERNAKFDNKAKYSNTVPIYQLVENPKTKQQELITVAKKSRNVQQEINEAYSIIKEQKQYMVDTMATHGKLDFSIIAVRDDAVFGDLSSVPKNFIDKDLLIKNAKKAYKKLLAQDDNAKTKYPTFETYAINYEKDLIEQANIDHIKSVQDHLKKITGEQKPGNQGVEYQGIDPTPEQNTPGQQTGKKEGA